MADWVMRCLLTVLHVCMALASGGTLVAVMLQWTQDLNCLPPSTDGFGDPLLIKNALLHMCDIITVGSGVMCGLSLLMALTINCCWGTWCWSCLHQLLTLLICVASMGSGTALTVDFLLWCNSLQNAVPYSTGCESAAAAYDDLHRTSNMTAYYRKMELQQGCQWAVVPIALFTVIVYTAVLKKHSQPQGTTVRIRGRYFILQEDQESAPLYCSQDSLPPATFTTSPPPPPPPYSQDREPTHTEGRTQEGGGT